MNNREQYKNIDDAVSEMITMFREVASQKCVESEPYKLAVRDCVHACGYEILYRENGNLVAAPIAAMVSPLARDCIEMGAK